AAEAEAPASDAASRGSQGGTGVQAAPSAQRPLATEQVGTSRESEEGSIPPPTLVMRERPRLLAPRFPEDHYPREPDEAGYMPGVPLGQKGTRFAMHGYFRAPMRITPAARPEGPQKPGEGDTNWRTPYLVDDAYFNSGFAYTPLNETDFSELYLSVGN